MSADATVNPIQLTNDTFASEVLQSSIPVVVDFWAPWCGPCRVVKPIVEALATEFAGQAKVAKLNIDDHPELATQYAVHAIPTLLFFQNGQVVDKAVGVVSKQSLAAKLNTLLDRHSASAA